MESLYCLWWCVAAEPIVKLPSSVAMARSPPVLIPTPEAVISCLAITVALPPAESASVFNTVSTPSTVVRPASKRIFFSARITASPPAAKCPPWLRISPPCTCNWWFAAIRPELVIVELLVFWLVILTSSPMIKAPAETKEALSFSGM